MFEKEAKERARKLEESQTLGVYYNEEDYERDRGWNEGEVSGYEEGFKDGAEFGYNKAKEEIQEQGLALQSDMDKTIEQNIALKKQIEKLEKLVPKTCENCVGYGCHARCVDCDFKDKWEIKENDKK